MKNLNEPRKRDESVQRDDLAAGSGARSEAEVVQFQRRSGGTGTLLPNRQVEELRGRWSMIQTNFVDQPRQAVEDADSLVANAIKQIEEVFVAQRSNLEKKWRHGEQVSTEDLRVSLQHYRDFFDHLLSITDRGSE